MQERPAWELKSWHSRIRDDYLTHGEATWLATKQLTKTTDLRLSQAEIK